MIKIDEKKSGFTLIELLLVIAIIGIIAASTGAIFRKFSANQNMSVAYDNLQNALAEAKSNALSHVVINCNDTVGVLVGYQIIFNNPVVRQYSLQEICSVGGVNTFYQIKPYQLPPGIEFSNSPQPVIFNVLSGGAQGTYTITIRKTTDTSQTRTINVNPAGVIQ